MKESPPQKRQEKGGREKTEFAGCGKPPPAGSTSFRRRKKRGSSTPWSGKKSRLFSCDQDAGVGRRKERRTRRDGKKEDLSQKKRKKGTSTTGKKQPLPLGGSRREGTVDKEGDH